MTQEKLKRVVTAAAVAGTLVVVCLLAVILYQVIKIVVLNNRIDKVEVPLNITKNNFPKTRTIWLITNRNFIWNRQLVSTDSFIRAIRWENNE